MAHLLVLRSRCGEAVQFAARAQVIGDAIGELALQVGATFYLGTACHGLGRYNDAADHFRRTCELVQDTPDSERFGLAGVPSVLAGAYAAQALAELGRFDDALGIGQEALIRAERADHPWSIVMVSWRLAQCLAIRGDFSRATPLLTKAAQLCETWHIEIMTPFVASSLGYSYAFSGRLPEAQKLSLRSLHQCIAMNVGLFRPQAMVHAGEVALMCGRIPEAFELARNALQSAVDAGERGYEAWATRLLGDIARTEKDVDAGTQYYAAALKLASDLGVRPLVAHCHFGLASLYHRTRRGEDARGHLARATSMYREMSMTHWLGQAEREMARTGF